MFTGKNLNTLRFELFNMVSRKRINKSEEQQKNFSPEKTAIKYHNTLVGKYVEHLIYLLIDV